MLDIYKSVFINWAFTTLSLSYIRVIINHTQEVHQLLEGAPLLPTQVQWLFIMLILVLVLVQSI